MTAAEKWLDAISHNLANASTTAYKRDAILFNEGLERMLSADGGTGAQIGDLAAGPATQGIYTIWEVGAIQPTGNSLDLAIANPNAAFRVQTASGPQFCRGGNFSLDATGQIVTGLGEPLLDAQGEPIRIDAHGPIRIDRDGTLSVNDQPITRIPIYQGVFQKVGGDRYLAANAQEVEPGQVEIRQGALEASNVNPITEMISMIKLNKAFEMAQKSAQSQDESTERLLRILQG